MRMFKPVFEWFPLNITVPLEISEKGTQWAVADLIKKGVEIHQICET